MKRKLYAIEMLYLIKSYAVYIKEGDDTFYNSKEIINLVNKLLTEIQKEEQEEIKND
jgi:hypothetical protein